MAENGAGEMPVLIRRFSRSVSKATENMEAALEDLSEFLNLTLQVETVVEEQAAAEEAAASKDQTPEAAAKGKAQGAAKLEAGFFDPTKIRMRDKIVFFLGVMNVG